MSNLLDLPMIDGANTTFAIAFDSDWRDQIYVGAPGFSGTPISATGAIITGEADITGLSTVLGMAAGCLVQGPGIPAGARIGTVSSGTAITLVDASGNALDATETLADGAFTFFAPPLDLTGISFRCQVRSALGSNSVLLDASTDNGMMVNSGASGLFGFAVTAAQLRASALLSAVKAAGGEADFIADIVATDKATGNKINLCPDAPFAVQARLGTTR